MHRSIIPVLLLTLLAACEKPAEQPEYRPVTGNHEMMTRVLDPQVEVIWDSAGFIITAAGERNLAPTTIEGWEAVARAATVLSESGNLLMMPGRSLGESWNAHAARLIETSQLALAAAEARDETALFDAGGRIYQACLACHNQYWVVLDETDECGIARTCGLQLGEP